MIQGGMLLHMEQNVEIALIALELLRAAIYNMAPAKVDATIMPNRPNPALLTCGTTRPAAAPGLPLAPAPLPVPLALPLARPLAPALVALAVELAPLVGVPVAVAVLLLLHIMLAGLIPLPMKQTLRSLTDCWTDKQ